MKAEKLAALEKSITQVHEASYEGLAAMGLRFNADAEKYNQYQILTPAAGGNAGAASSSAAVASSSSSDSAHRGIGERERTPYSGTGNGK